MATSTTIKNNSWWASAIENAGSLLDDHRAEATRHADEYARTYQGRRAAMVFDVVASRQRRYDPRVLRMVERFEIGSPTLESLAHQGPGSEFGLRGGEAQTMQGVASGLLAFATDHGFDDEDSAAKDWQRQ